MIQNSRILIIDNGKILVIHRFNDGKEYYVLPGGHVDAGETPEEAAVREAKEETNLDIEKPELLWDFEDEHLGEKRNLYLFCTERFTGDEIKMIGPEIEHFSDNNKFDLEWIPISEIEKINLKPSILKAKLLEKFK